MKELKFGYCLGSGKIKMCTENKESIEKIKKYPYKDGVISIIGASITIIVGLLILLTCIYESDIIINNKLYI